MQKLHVLWFYVEKQILLQEIVCVWGGGGGDGRGAAFPLPPFLYGPVVYVSVSCESVLSFK